MTLPEPTDIIAPRGDDVPYDTIDFLREMFLPAYTVGSVVEYHGFKLFSQQHDGGLPVWDVFTPDEEYIETLNLAAFQTVTEFEKALNEIVAYDPDDRDDWVGR